MADLLGSQVVERSGEPGSASVAGSFVFDGMFTNTEDGRTDPFGTLPGFASGVFVVDAFDRGRTDAFAIGEDITANSPGSEGVQR